MAKGFQASQLINRPADEVWRYLSDMSRGPEWLPGIKDVKPVTDTDMGPGKKFTVTLSTVGRGTEREMTLSEWDPPHTLSLWSQEGHMTAVYRYQCRQNGEGTLVTLDASCDAGSLLTKLLHPLIVFMMERHDRPQLTNLKERLEANR